MIRCLDSNWLQLLLHTYTHYFEHFVALDFGGITEVGKVARLMISNCQLVTT